MKEKLLTIWWFIQRPIMYGQIWQLFLRRFFLRNDRYKEYNSIKWCKANAKSEKEAISFLYPGKEFLSLLEVENEIISKAELKVKNSPFEMGGAGALDLIYNIALINEAHSVLETGVAYGWSSLAFLLAMENQNGKLYSVDMPYPKMGNENYVGLIVPENLKENWKLFRMPDRVGIKKAINEVKGKFDIVHYDSDKSYSGRKWAYPILWDSLNKNGVFISDDIQDNIAFKEFCEFLKKVPVLVESQGKYVGILIK